MYILNIFIKKVVQKNNPFLAVFHSKIQKNFFCVLRDPKIFIIIIILQMVIVPLVSLCSTCQREKV